MKPYCFTQSLNRTLSTVTPYCNVPMSLNPEPWDWKLSPKLLPERHWLLGFWILGG